MGAGFEATSMFWLTLHAWLQRQGFGALFVLNPLRTKAFRYANLRGSKTDKIDAVAIARLLRWSRATLSVHSVPRERVTAARELHRLRVEMIQLRGRQRVRLKAVLERVFPEFAQHFASPGSAGALAVLERWPTPAALAGATERRIGAVLDRASDGHCGTKRAAAKAAALHQAAADSVRLADPFDASATAIRTIIGHLEHLTAHVEALGQAALSVYPIARPDTTPASYTACATAKPLTRAMMGWFAKQTTRTTADLQDPPISLAKTGLGGLPPVTIINAQIDPLLDDGAMPERAPREAGNPVEPRLYDAVAHEFFGMAAVADKAKHAQAYAGQRLRRAFG